MEDYYCVLCGAHMREWGVGESKLPIDEQIAELQQRIAELEKEK